MKPCISLHDVSIFLPGQEESVLRNLNLNVGQGEWLAVVGLNGCGKSVLGRLLAGLAGRYSGEIHRTADGIRGRVCVVMQNPEAQLVGDTVREEVILALEHRGLPAEEILARSEGALRLVGLWERREQPVEQLSGGQKQLLAMAGAVSLHPSVLVADEATAMLDPESRHKVLELMKVLHQQGVSIVMITQLLEETVYAERLIALDQGRLAYDGDVREFFYGERLDGRSLQVAPCQGMGLELPYSVQVAHNLLLQGIRLPGKPLTADELLEAVDQASLRKIGPTAGRYI